MSGPVASGGCLCGAVRLELDGPLADPHWCACRRCRRWAGSPVVAWVDVRASDLRFPAGEPAWFEPAPGQRRGHCARCGSALCVFDDGSEIASVVLACLDDPDPYRPAGVSYAESLPTWLPASGFAGSDDDAASNR
ncbi:MAG: GFA family protein [Actinomycetota bacterium]